MRKTATGVFVSEGPVICVGREELALLREEACNAPLRRARICAHPQASSPLHEMMVALCNDSYIPPHRHVGKSESFHVVEGKAWVCLFDEQGNVRQVISMDTGGCFFYRLSDAIYHTVLVNSPLFIIHETTNGPFDPTQTHKAPFAPSGEDPLAAAQYMDRLRHVCAASLEQINFQIVPI